MTRGAAHDDLTDAVPDLLFRGGHRLPCLVSPARRRGPGGHHRQVLLPHLPLPAAVLRAPLPPGLSQDRDVSRVDEIGHPSVREPL